MVLVAAADRAETCPSPRRLGVTVSRAVGNSVARNHVKRRIREWYRLAGEALERLGSADIVVIARRGAAALGGQQISRELAALTTRLGAKR